MSKYPEIYIPPGLTPEEWVEYVRSHDLPINGLPLNC